MRTRGSKSGVETRPQNRHFPQRLSAFRNGFLISSTAFLNAFLLSIMAFWFPQWLSASKLFISWIICSTSKLFISWIICLQCLHLTQQCGPKRKHKIWRLVEWDIWRDGLGPPRSSARLPGNDILLRSVRKNDKKHDWVNQKYHRQLPRRNRGHQPATNHLFTVRDESLLKPLPEEQARAFHHASAQLFFLSARDRCDIQPAIAFLTTQVRCPHQKCKSRWYLWGIKYPPAMSQ